MKEELTPLLCTSSAAAAAAAEAGGLRWEADGDAADESSGSNVTRLIEIDSVLFSFIAPL